MLTGLAALQEWCRRVTAGYPGVNITDMTESWRSGLGFCAILARFRPDLLDFNCLKSEEVWNNCNLAFSLAEEELGVPALLEPKDMHIMDERSIITYLALLYHRLNQEKPQTTARRVLSGSRAKDSGLDESYSSISSRESSPPPSNSRSSKAKFLHSLLEEKVLVDSDSEPWNENLTPDCHRKKKTHAKSYESLIDYKSPKFEASVKSNERKASSFLAALEKFNSLSTSNLPMQSSVRDKPVKNVFSSFSQTETMKSSKATQTEDISLNYSDIYHTYYYQHSQLFATLV